MPKVKIFLSSTFLDLSEVRQKISSWLSGIFGADLIIMETAGSDTAPPDISSVRRVRECDLFVGIYAHRYGTVNQKTGKSITELELDEAKIAHSAGTLSDILLYIIDFSSPWPDESKEINDTAQVGLKRLRKKAQQHTYTLFKKEDELLFYIIRDVYKRISERFNIPPFKVRQSVIPDSKILSKPIGMEFLTSEYRNYLIGREKETDDILARLNEDSIVLLLGDSGVGKTSLIHAGLLPKIKDKGFRAIYARPLGLPCKDVIRQIQTTIFEGQLTLKESLVALLAEVAAAIKGENILLIIDQFEDVLAARDYREIELLISELRSIHNLISPSVRVLISYRADLEGQLGEYWQKISGSPQGLLRVYLQGINKDQAWEGVKKIAKDLSISIELNETEQIRVRNDLLVASQSLGFTDVYPPYIQMLVDHVWSSLNKARGKYYLKHYQEAKGMDGVIGGYLARQLEYAQDKEGDVRLVLVSLVRSYGVKAQRSINEVVADTGLSKIKCEAALEKLIDLRLVRHIDTYYEISHDFIARRIFSEFVDSEIHEIKRFRELLTSKAAAYQVTEALFTPEELLMLYKHREKVIPNELELRFLLISWINGIGPALYWLLNAEPKKILDWLRAEESKESLTRDEKVSIILLRRKLGESPLVDDDYSAFRSYRLSAEISALILEAPYSLSKELVFSGLRHPREEVQVACRKVIALNVKHGDWSWIGQLRKSSSLGCRKAYEELILREDVPIPPEEGDRDRAIEEFTLLKKIVLANSSYEARNIFKMLKKARMPARSLLFGKALTYIRAGKIKILLSNAKQSSKERAEVLFAAINSRITSDDFKFLLNTYKEWNLIEKERYTTPALHAKARSLSSAILRSSSYKYLSHLRQTIKYIRLTPSAREVVLALLKHGNLNDLKLVLNRVEKADDRIDFWNHTELGRTVARRMTKIKKRIPKFLTDISDKKEFWEYIPREERAKLPDNYLLPIRSLDNRSLYVRLAAYAMVGAANEEDQDRLLDLANHSYSLIASAAMIRLVHLVGDNAFQRLRAKIDESIKKRQAELIAEALRSAEIEFFGVASLW